LVQGRGIKELIAYVLLKELNFVDFLRTNKYAVLRSFLLSTQKLLP
jgi:hypothetical protein